MAAKKTPATVAAAVAADLKEIAKREPRLASGSLAASALSIARRMDQPAAAPGPIAQLAKELRETMSLLHALAPPEQRKDGLDELAERRVERRRGAKAADL